MSKIRSILLNKQKWHQKAVDLFSVDLRSIAFFRVGIALLLLCDLKFRSEDLVAFYTDEGVLPRSSLVGSYRSFSFCFHLMNGTAEFQAALFLIAAFFALWMLFGYRTRLATIISWIFLVSLQNRNGGVLQGGDTYLRMLLFWAMFLPLGQRYSVDAALNTNEDPPSKYVMSAASFALMAQTSIVYIFTAALKSTSAWMSEGSAVYIALANDRLSSDMGHFLLNFPEALKYLTYLVFYFELAGPWLLFMPIFTLPIRFLTALAFFFMQLNFALCLSLGFFPWVSSVALIPFIPGFFWDKLRRWTRSKEGLGLKVYYDQNCGFCKKMVLLITTFLGISKKSVYPAQKDLLIKTAMEDQRSWVVMSYRGEKTFRFEAFTKLVSASPIFRFALPLLRLPFVMRVGDVIYKFCAARREWGGRLLSPLTYRNIRFKTPWYFQIFVLFCLLYVIVWNLGSVNIRTYRIPRSLYWTSELFDIRQRWSMFAPRPSRYSGWYAFSGTLVDGTKVDPFHDGQPVKYYPKRPWATYKNQRWSKYLRNIRPDSNKRGKERFSKFICESWNKSHSGNQALQRFDMDFMGVRTSSPTKITGPKKARLYSYDCFQKRAIKPKKKKATTSKKKNPVKSTVQSPRVKIIGKVGEKK